MQFQSFFLLTFASWVSLSPTASAQLLGGAMEDVHVLDGESRGDGFGSSVAAIADLDGDGVRDFLVGAPWADPGGRWLAGIAYAYSGATGTLIHRFEGPDPGGRFGHVVTSAGDVDADGLEDILVGAPFTTVAGGEEVGSVYLYSGATGALLSRHDGEGRRSQFGYAVSTAGDPNGDGHADFLIGAPGAWARGVGGSGSAVLVSGADGSSLMRFRGRRHGARFGCSVAGLGDIDGDGKEDCIIGEERVGSPWVWGLGNAYVHSGADGGLIRQHEGSQVNRGFGKAVAGVVDLDGDGIRDYMVSEPGADVPDPWEDIENAGITILYSGATGAEVFRIEGQREGIRQGCSLAHIGDFDADGVEDVLTGVTFQGVTGAAIAYAGDTGKKRRSIYATNYGMTSVSGLGDLDGDGYTEFLLGLSSVRIYAGVPRRGQVRVVRLNPFLAVTTRDIPISSGISLTFAIDFPLETAGLGYKILMSAAGPGPSWFGMDIPLTRGKVLGDSFAGLYPVSTHQGLQGSLDGFGDATGSMTIPAGLPPRFLGRFVWVAAVATSTPGEVEWTSIAIPLRFVP